MDIGMKAGDWECKRILGKGSYGIVGLWENSETQERIAIKKFEVQAHPPPSETVLADLQNRYREEVSLMYNKIDNAHIVATVTVPAELVNQVASDLQEGYEPVAQSGGPLPLLGMEFCSGGDLRQVLRRPENLNGLQEKDIRRVLAHISNAISYLHENDIVHRDIKPENIVIQWNGPEVNYKLSDLGFAKDLSGNDSMCSTILGTLPYLAPEIYFGEKYDMTVDYWSFGLITFELMCGMRPFLPGESPAVWIPLAKKKDKDVIAIYRNEEGSVEYSKDVPYNTHLSQLFRKCLVAWLPSMLQLDPARRGKYVLTNEQWKTGSGDANALTRLRNMLNTKFLEIRAFSDRLVYAIGRTIKVSEIQKCIARDTGVAENNQLILTADGDKLSSDELAIKYLEANKDLYLLPKSVSEISSKIKLSKLLTSFLSSDWKASRDIGKNRMIWVSAIYFVQRHLQRMESLTNVSDALRLYHEKTCLDQLNKLDQSIEKAWHSLQNLIELEEKLVMVEARHELPNVDAAVPTTEIKNESEELRRVSKEILSSCSADLQLEKLQILQLRDLYYKVLRLYDTWRNPETESTALHSMELLVRFICEFVKHRQSIITAASANIKRLFERITCDEELKDTAQILLAKMNSLIDQIFSQRIQRQKKILSAGFPKQSPPKLLNGFKESNAIMTQSFSGVENNNSLMSNNQGPSTMTQSLCVGSSRRSSFSPDFTKLMEESMVIQEALSSSVAQVESLLTENAELESNYFG